VSAQHTPGPWVLASSNSWRRIVTQFNMREVCVPTKQQDGHPDLHFPNEADADLIAAAPELLGALIEIEEFYATLGSQSDDAGVKRVHRLASAVIAKATGGAA
jgi:hypothetical protein